MRDAVLRLVFRYLVTDKSTAWMYSHRVEWDRPMVGDPARASAPAHA
jgi:hypothetical protein